VRKSEVPQPHTFKTSALNGGKSSSRFCRFTGDISGKKRGAPPEPDWMMKQRKIPVCVINVTPGVQLGVQNFIYVFWPI
jgi:hypothetical protein